MSKLKISYKIRNNQITHHYRPGEFLNDLELKRLVNDLITINKESKHPVENKMIKEGLTLEMLREIYKNTIVCIFHEGNHPIGFLLSPIVGNDKIRALHLGLIIVTKNFGSDLIFLSGSGNNELAYKNWGSFFVTNIASTPSIIEAFSFAYSDAWPSPKANLRSTPKEKVPVLDLLNKNYISKYFPDNSNVQIDQKRFVMSSTSQDMGFNTNMRQLSRASNFMYQSFCHTWVNYEKEEDIIQVAKHGLWEHFRNKLITYALRLRSMFKSEKRKTIQKEKIQTNDTNEKQVA